MEYIEILKLKKYEKTILLNYMHKFILCLF